MLVFDSFNGEFVVPKFGYIALVLLYQNLTTSYNLHMFGSVYVHLGLGQYIGFIGIDFVRIYFSGNHSESCDIFLEYVHFHLLYNV